MTFQISDVASIVDIWPGPNFWSILYVIISCLSGYLAFNTKKDASESSPQYKLRALITMLISGASLSRGIIILILFGNVAGFILQLWFAFVIVWAAPLIFFLPSEIDEYVTLMDRVDRLDKRVDGILNGKSK
jgi:ABC-type transport system involved in multi-copper enzyme maturation permease subunit